MSRRASLWLTAGTLLAAVLFAYSSSTAQEEGRIGAETCAICHDELAASFAANIHYRTDSTSSCENCHGPGVAHVDGEGDPTLIRRFGDEQDPVSSSGACLACHGRERSHRKWKSGYHAGGGLACDNCHSIHKDSVADSPSGQPAECYRCHGDIRAQFELVESHPVAQGAMLCTDCHDPHAAAERWLLGGFKQTACLRCHSEYRGPWFFEHEVVAVEGCSACHTPHGSINRHLLTYQRVGDLCIQCHSGQPFFHVAEDAGGGRTTGINDCTRCHSEIHGSNNDALFLN